MRAVASGRPDLEPFMDDMLKMVSLMTCSQPQENLNNAAKGMVAATGLPCGTTDISIRDRVASSGEHLQMLICTRVCHTLQQHQHRKRNKHNSCQNRT